MTVSASNWLDGSAEGLAAAVRQGEITAVAVARESIRRCLALQTSTNAIHALDEQAVLARAAEIDGQVEAGIDPGRLAGVPVGIKDNIAVRGRPTTCGSRILSGYVSPYNAHVIDLIEDEGAIPIGRANMDEFAMGSSSESCAWGPVGNPWDSQRVPGGSSGGCAALVAGGAVPLALGSDTGGSVRQPAAFTGLVGMKPTYGRVSRRGLVAYASSTDQVSPFARNVADAALLLHVTSGHDPLDSTSLARAVSMDVGKSIPTIEGLKIGVPVEFLRDGLQPGVLHTLRNTMRSVVSLGATVTEITLPTTDLAVACYYVLAPAEASANLARFDGIRYGARVQANSLDEVYAESRSAGFGAEVKRRILMGTFALSAGYVDAYYNQAQRVRAQLTAELASTFETVDAILSPTAPTTAFRFQEREDPISMYLGDVFTIPASLAGTPAISIPLGTADGLPVGIQIMTAYNTDDVTIRIAKALEFAQSLSDRRQPSRPPGWVG